MDLFDKMLESASKKDYIGFTEFLESVVEERLSEKIAENIEEIEDSIFEEKEEKKKEEGSDKEDKVSEEEDADGKDSEDDKDNMKEAFEACFEEGLTDNESFDIIAEEFPEATDEEINEKLALGRRAKRGAQTRSINKG